MSHAAAGAGCLKRTDSSRLMGLSLWWARGPWGPQSWNGLKEELVLAITSLTELSQYSYVVVLEFCVTDEKMKKHLA